MSTPGYATVGQPENARSPDGLVSTSALLAGSLPPLLAFNLTPSATMINQCAAVALWGWWVVALAPGQVVRALWPLAAALGLMAAAVVWSMTAGALPASLGNSALGLLGGALLLAWAGGEAAQRREGTVLFGAFADGLLLAGLLSALVALAQVFAPEFGDPNLIARSGIVGRAVGNLRQPNQLCSLLQWALIAAVLRSERGRLHPAPMWAIAALLVFAVELSGSRTGAAGLALLTLWGLLDRRLTRRSRSVLLAVPVLFALSYAAMAVYGQWAHQTIGAATRLAEAGGIDSANARSRIWANALAMIADEPWTGVGFGEFNIAWTLTPFPGRPTAFFDHTHTLPLQLAVELGLPLSGLAMALLALALWRAWQRSGRAGGEAGSATRAAWLMVLTIGLHSMVEYPLWYAYFLLPSAFAWGYALAAPASPRPPGGRGAPRLAAIAAGLALVAGGIYATVDYLRVVEIYAPGEHSGSLESRIARGQRSVFFAHHADYAAATSGEPGPGADLGFERSIHSLLDTRLMIAWSRHLAAGGQIDLARALAQRLREFRNPDAETFFAPCDIAAPAPRPFQCEAPQSAHPWREFVAAEGN